jgi:AGZA family xanthine/uracil permease-like MFS transporter
MLDKFFKITEQNSTVKTEVIAGITTFMTMVYILAVNPSILSTTGMDKGAVFTATAVSAIVATLVMALVAKLPFALAPGMGLNAFFAFTVVLGMGYSWQFALTAVFLEGIIFILLTLFNIREWIVDAIPIQLKHAVSVGIGLFIAFIGLKSAGIVVEDPVNLVKLGSMKSPTVIIGVTGVLITGFFLIRKVKGAILLGILASAVLGYFLGVTILPVDFKWFSLPPSVAPVFFKFEFSQVFTLDMLLVLFTFLFVDIFDTLGTLIGVASKSNMLTPEGKIPRIKQALLADSIGTFVGAILGTSTVTTYVESASGVAEGGRTGLTALTTAGMFALALFFEPVFTMIPAAATASALIIVGLFMITPIQNINFKDHTEAIPAFLTLIMMPLTFSIAEGIMFGLTSYVFLKLLAGKYKEINPFLYVIVVLFLIKYYI